MKDEQLPAGAADRPPAHHKLRVKGLACAWAGRIGKRPTVQKREPHPAWRSHNIELRSGFGIHHDIRRITARKHADRAIGPSAPRQSSGSRSRERSLQIDHSV